MINFLVWIVVGGLIGWLASKLMGTDAEQGVLLNVVVGIAGAFLAGIVLTPLLGGDTINQNDFSILGLIMSFLGAVILLGIVNLFRKGAVR